MAPEVAEVPAEAVQAAAPSPPKVEPAVLPEDTLPTADELAKAAEASEANPLAEIQKEFEVYHKASNGAGASIRSAFVSGNWKPERGSDAWHGRNGLLAKDQQNPNSPEAVKKEGAYYKRDGSYRCQVDGEWQTGEPGRATIEHTAAAVRSIADTEETILADANADRLLKQVAAQQAEVLERRTADLKELSRRLPDFGLQGHSPEVVTILDEFAAGNEVFVTAQAKLIELGGVIGKIKEDPSWSNPEVQALFGRLSETLGTGQSPEELFKLFTDKKRQEEQKRLLQGKGGLIFMALVYLCMGVGAGAQAAAGLGGLEGRPSH